MAMSQIILEFFHENDLSLRILEFFLAEKKQIHLLEDDESSVRPIKAKTKTRKI